MNKKLIILSSIIFFLALFLRTHNLPNIFVFTFDEEYQASYALTLIKHFHLIWIGVSASFLDYYMGPLFTYLTAFLLAISKGDPVITAYTAAVTGSITAILIFFIGQNFFNLTTGLLAAILYATLPLFIFYDQKFWNPMFTPLITLAIFTTINLTFKSKWWWVVFATLTGLIFETELAPAPLILIGVWLFIKGKYWKNLRLIFFCLLAFLILYWPLVIFDINHNFSNISVLSRLTKQINKTQLIFDPLTKFEAFFDSLGRIWYLKPGNSNADEINISCSKFTVKEEYRSISNSAERTYANPWFSLFSFAGMIIFLRLGLKNKNRAIKLLAVFISLLIISFFIYPGSGFEYHNLQLFSLLLFIPGIFLSNINFKKQLIFIAFLSIVILLGINTVFLSSDKFSLGPKKKLISEVMNIIDENTFSIDGRGICHNWEGWRYLFKIYGKTPLKSYTDQSLGWLYPDEIKGIGAKYTVILSEDRVPLTENFSNLPSVKSGGYRAYIRKN